MNTMMKRILSAALAVLLVCTAPVTGIADYLSAAAEDDFFVDLRYTVQNGEVTIDGTNTGGMGEFLVPGEIDGYPVTTIGPLAFQGHGFTSVVIPDTVRWIANGCFEDCASLTRVTIGNGVSTIEDYVFAGCTSLTDVTFGSSMQDVGNCAFAGCTSLESMILPDGVTCIGDYAFAGCEALRFVHIPQSVTEIGSDVFLSDASAYICCGTADSTAQTYAEENGILFRTCASHGDHVHSYAAVVTEPTCTKSGYTTYTCSVCGDSYTTNYTDPLGHDYCYFDGTVGSCTTDTTRGYACRRCPESYYETVPACGHEFGEWFLSGCPSMHSVGLIERICTGMCVQEVWLPQLEEPTGICGRNGGNVIWSFDTAAGVLTISGSGEMTYGVSNDVPWSDFFDSITSVIISDGVTSIADNAFVGCTALRFVHIPSSVTEIGDCLPYGSSVGICSDTADGEAKSYADFLHTDFRLCTEHVGHVHDFNVVTVEPTCTEDGSATYTCECGFTYTIGLPASAHDFDAVVTEPTCTENGCTIYTCSHCGMNVTDVNESAYGHDYRAVSVIRPTCTEGGYTIYACSRCGEGMTADYTDALGHDFRVSGGTAGSCTEDHVTEYECTRCCATSVDVEPAPGHNFGEWYVSVEPTADSEGLEERICARCMCVEERLIPKLPPETGPVFALTGGKAHAGETVEVTVSVQDNPGIVSVLLCLNYDPQVLTLVDVRNGEVFAADAFKQGGNLTEIPYKAAWLTALSDNNTRNGTLVTYIFAVAADAPTGSTTVSITYEPESTFDTQMQLVAFAVQNAQLDLIARKAGDTNGDGTLDLKDAVTLIRSIVGGWGASVIGLNADVNGDNSTDLRDAALILRFLAGGWDVELI